jgi:hypothetical protein
MPYRSAAAAHDAERTEVRSLSTRAKITATSFVNEYHWGDFKGDPSRLMERYYDRNVASALATHTAGLGPDLLADRR